MAYIALGSNLGDRATYLAQARAAIGELPGTQVTGASSVEDTKAIGPIMQGPFLNQMLRVETTLEPLELLAHLQRLEDAAGRVRGARWGPRTLDLDIVLIDGEAIDHPSLTLPHPELPARGFWQRELAELRGVER